MLQRHLARRRRTGCPNGMVLFNELLRLVREENARRGYEEVKTPVINDVNLWQPSGHWDKYRDNMYFVEIDGRQFGLKPMNCPNHIQIYKADRALLPRPSAALLRGRARAPPRAARACSTGSCACAVHPGRRPHLLQRGADRGGGPGLPRPRLPALRALRPGAAARALDAARAAPGHGRLWDHAETALGQRDAPQRARVRDRRGRGRVLRPEDRRAHDRLDRALVAARHGPARLPDAGALRAPVHRRRRRAATAR